MELQEKITALKVAALAAAGPLGRTEAGARSALESIGWLGFELTEGQKISASRLVKQAAKEQNQKKTHYPQIYADRRQLGESLDDYAARLLTGRYDL